MENEGKESNTTKGFNIIAIILIAMTMILIATAILALLYFTSNEPVIQAYPRANLFINIYGSLI